MTAAAIPEGHTMTKHEAEVRATIRASQIAKGLRREEPTDRVSLPATERGRSERDLARLDVINARLTRGYQDKRGKTAAEQREEDLRRREALEREISDREEERRRLLAQAEADVLAAGRGEEVSTDSSGVKRILDRDPIARLAQVGKLTAQQMETGQEVRDLYDLRSVDAGAMEYTGMPSSGHNHERFVAKRFERAKACEMIGRIERTVAMRCKPPALNMLRAVCEREMSLTSQGRGRAYERNAAALASALDIADDVLRRRL